MTTQNTVRTVVSYLPIGGLLLLIATLPFHYGWVQRAALYWLALAYPVDYIVNKRWQAWHWNRRKAVYILMMLLFLMTPLRQLFDAAEPTPFYLRQLDQRAAFLFVGLIGFLGFSDKLRPRYVGYVMLATSVVIIGYVAYLTLRHPGVYEGNWIVQFNMWRRSHVHSHMVVSLYMNIALIFGYYILRQPYPQWLRGLVGAGMALVFGGVAIAEGRTGLATLLSLMLLIGIYTMVRYNKRLILPIALLLCGVGTVFLMMNQRFDRSHLEYEPRWVIWRFSADMAKEKPWGGYGLATLSTEYATRAHADEAMRERYIQGVLSCPQFDKLPKDNMAGVHPHNVFLLLQLENGFMGPLLFVGLLLSAGCCCARRYRIYIWGCIFVVVVQAMFESLGDHLLPIQIATVLFVWLYSSDLPEADKLSLGHRTKDAAPVVAPTA